MVAFKDHFSRQSQDYVQFRPHYPPELFEELARLSRNHSDALDIGTGNGQCAIGLAKHFSKVTGIDPSNNQIQSAIPHPSVRYRVAPAEDTGCEDESMDIITVAQAIHWFDHEPFFAEIHRVLRPGALFAAWGYGHHFVDGCQDTLEYYYHNIVGPYWPPERESIEARYTDIRSPEWLVPVAPPDVKMQAEWNRDQLLGYISTWSAVQKYIEQKASDPVQILRSQLSDCWPDPGEVRQVSWPFFFIIGRKPG
ncbi:MAG TPA: SAM-dependent methyltransferase [Leptospiraceae bacterium]|nr:SAM-dependent methyltransferase [Spirochaetaceae bacterium]HBS05955.1 SAM-dependent methyltransferase [Leptospiraceae bacterium]|tara:strand:+ start:8603 stop:9358 length:756 start_codon:yes stop_codon:yes gene_type:complete